MTAAADAKLRQYLAEAHATEAGLVRTLQAHIAMTPRGEYRTGLERHLGETRDHAARVERRLGELGAADRSPVEAGVGLVQTALAQALALSKGPLDALRGSGGEERLLKNAKDECATEALEIATYEALERLAERLGDDRTAELARAIRADEERMLAHLRAQLPKLADDVVDADLEDAPTFRAAETGAADAAREAAARVKRAAGTRARQVPGVAVAQGEAQGATAAPDDLPIPGYDGLNADEVAARLEHLPRIDIAKIDAYERRHQNRSTVLEHIGKLLESDEPWGGYDEQSVAQIRARLSDDAPVELLERVRRYEREHKDRRGVLALTERAAAPSRS